MWLSQVGVEICECVGSVRVVAGDRRPRLVRHEKPPHFLPPPVRNVHVQDVAPDEGQVSKV